MERIDDLQFKNLKIIQDSELFCFGTDAVLLADFVAVPKNAVVVDLGTGTGILPILLYGRQEQAHYYGVEIQPKLCAIAQRSVVLNGIEDCVVILEGDIAGAYKHLGNGNDVVVANPPYEKAEDGAARDPESHRIARKETKITFVGICEAASRLLRSGGRFYLIHKASRLPELFCTLKRFKLEPKLLRMIHSYADREPKYVLICATKDANEFLRVMPPLVIYHADGTETDEVRRIYHRE